MKERAGGQERAMRACWVQEWLGKCPERKELGVFKH